MERTHRFMNKGHDMVYRPRTNLDTHYDRSAIGSAKGDPTARTER